MQANPLHLDDLWIRDRILGGDRQVAEEFFERHLDTLYEFVHYRVGGNRAVAEDLVQDTMLVAVEKLAGFNGQSSLYTWLCGIAKNKLRAHRRKRGAVPLEDVLEAADPEIDAILAELERAELPEDVLVREETRALVGATLSSLTPEYRQALLDKYVSELSVAEIAAKSGRGEKATESHLHRARLAFARVFELLAKRRGGLGEPPPRDPDSGPVR